jgi:3-deoxy-D-arabino-heptulosonate 7-phosphate (DAHP) synthase
MIAAEQDCEQEQAVSDAGATMVRGGAHKPRKVISS